MDLLSGIVQQELQPEQERESLLNVVRSIRQQSNPVSRLLYVAKINSDSKNKLDPADDTEQWIKNNCQEGEATGILLALGSFVVHLFEAPSDCSVALMKYLTELRSNAVPPYLTINVVNFTEENPTRMFSHWMNKQMPLTGSSTAEECTKAEIPIRSYEVYKSVCQIGPNIIQAMGGKQQPTGSSLTQALKGNCVANIPSQEVLLMLTSEDFTSLDQLYSEYMEPQDVCLDNEYIWPVPPELEF